MHVKIIHPIHVDFPVLSHEPGFLDMDEFLPVGVIKFDDDEIYHPISFTLSSLGRGRQVSVLTQNRLTSGIATQQTRHNPHPRNYTAKGNVTTDSIGAAYYAALDETCTRIWGHAWNAALGKIFGLNRRTLQRDRVTNYFLPTEVAHKISYIASLDDAKEMGQMLIAVAEYDEFIRKSRPDAEPQEYAENFIRSALHIFYSKPEDVEE